MSKCEKRGFVNERTSNRDERKKNMEGISGFSFSPVGFRAIYTQTMRTKL